MICFEHPPRLTLRHGVSFHHWSLMRTFLLAVCVFVVVGEAGVCHAGPKKKGPAPAAAKKAGPAAPVASEAPPAEGAPAPTVHGPSRIDFDDRLIQGQTNKSGAVYLYDRKELKIRSMVKKRENFRDEIVGSLYDI